MNTIIKYLLCLPPFKNWRENDVKDFLVGSIVVIAYCVAAFLLIYTTF